MLHCLLVLIFIGSKNRKSVVQILLAHGANVKVDQQDHIGNTPLILAAMQDDMGSVDILLQAGADINKQGLGNTTALIEAVKCFNTHLEHTNLIRILLQNGAKASLRDNERKLAIDYINIESFDNKKSTCLKLALRKLLKRHYFAERISAEGGISPIHQQRLNQYFMEAILQGDNLFAKKLLTCGAQVNEVRDKDGQTALIREVMIAIDHVTIEMLLRAGANPNIRGAGNTTALIEAVKNADSINGANLYMVKMLLNYGADQALRDASLNDFADGAGILFRDHEGNLAVDYTNINPTDDAETRRNKIALRALLTQYLRKTIAGG